MTYTVPLRKAIAAGDLSAIRAALIAIVDRDKNFAEPQATQIADEVDAQLKSKNISLFEKDDGEPSLPSELEWNVDSWHLVKAAMPWNFSREKFVLAEKILTSLRASGKAGDALTPLSELPPPKPSGENERENNSGIGYLRPQRVDTHKVSAKPMEQGTSYRHAYGRGPGRQLRPQPRHATPCAPPLITGGALVVGGIVVGAFVAGTIGAIVGGGAGVVVSIKVLNKK